MGRALVLGKALHWGDVERVLGGHTHILDSCNDKRVSVCHV